MLAHGNILGLHHHRYAVSAAEAGHSSGPDRVHFGTYGDRADRLRPMVSPGRHVADPARVGTAAVVPQRHDAVCGCDVALAEEPASVRGASDFGQRGQYLHLDRLGRPDGRPDTRLFAR